MKQLGGACRYTPAVQYGAGGDPSVLFTIVEQGLHLGIARDAKYALHHHKCTTTGAAFEFYAFSSPLTGRKQTVAIIKHEEK